MAFIFNQQKVLHNYFKCEILWRMVRTCFDKTHISCIQCFPNINLESTTTNITSKPLWFLPVSGTMSFITETQLKPFEVFL